MSKKRPFIVKNKSNSEAKDESTKKTMGNNRKDSQHDSHKIASAEAAGKMSEAYSSSSVAEEETDKSESHDDYSFFVKWLEMASNSDERLTIGTMYQDIRSKTREVKEARRSRRDKVFAIMGIVAVGVGVPTVIWGAKNIIGKKISS